MNVLSSALLDLTSMAAQFSLKNISEEQNQQIKSIRFKNDDKN